MSQLVHLAMGRLRLDDSVAGLADPGGCDDESWEDDLGVSFPSTDVERDWEEEDEWRQEVEEEEEDEWRQVGDDEDDDDDEDDNDDEDDDYDEAEPEPEPLANAVDSVAPPAMADSAASPSADQAASPPEGEPESCASSSSLSAPPPSVSTDPGEPFPDLSDQRPVAMFCFVENTAAMQASQVNWEARLYVYTDNIFDLMEDVFYWNSANVVPRMGYVETNPASFPDEPRRAGWRCRRRYCLRSTEDDEVPWHGILWVYARELFVLSRFRVDLIDRLDVIGASAWNSDSKLIYWYDHRRPQDSFNAIFDNKFMGGAWPWPGV
ncbi:hypothetical protein CDD83_6064 [Cordyceps sp. RAO-2017]|nr:hypothetical protein CDD83_6064 [Cordyceps sp. RAO-2017]